MKLRILTGKDIINDAKNLAGVCDVETVEFVQLLEVEKLTARYKKDMRFLMNWHEEICMDDAQTCEVCAFIQGHRHE